MGGVGSNDTNLKIFVIAILGNRQNFEANFLHSHLHSEI